MKLSSIGKVIALVILMSVIILTVIGQGTMAAVLVYIFEMVQLMVDWNSQRGSSTRSSLRSKRT